MILDALQFHIVDLSHAVLDQLSSLATWHGVQDALDNYTLMFPAVMCVLWLCFAFVYVFGREWRLPMNGEFQPRVAVVVPAHNEELVIARTIEALLATEYPALEIHVASDGSSDHTVAIARRYQSRGVVVHDLQPNRGKSAALQHALGRVSSESDLFMVIDADTVVEPTTVRFMVQQFADERIVGVTGNPRVANVRNLLTAVQAMEYASIIGLIKRADSFWSGLFTVSGAAACFRTSELLAVGGWSTRTATEDIEISWRLQKAGHRLAYEPRAVVHVQSPQSPGALWRQRRRWSQGMAEVLRLHGNLLTTANPAVLPIAAQAIAMVIWLALVIWNVITAVVGLFAGEIEVTAAECAQAYMIFAIMLALFISQSFAAWTFDSHYVSRGLRLVPFAGLYPLYYWLIVVPAFICGLVRGLRLRPLDAGRWERTTRSAE